MQITMESIGSIEAAATFAVTLKPEWRPGLLGLEGFGHVVVVWLANRATWHEGFIQVPEPYRGGPERVGIFATPALRSKPSIFNQPRRGLTRTVLCLRGFFGSRA